MPKHRKKKPLTRRGRISNGTRLLPTVDGRTHWPRIVAATLQVLIEHCGGDGVISEPRRMAARRAAVLEAELVHLEDNMASDRLKGEAPPPTTLDLYSRLSNTQKRLCESLGLDRTSIDITPRAVRDEVLADIRKDATDVTDV